MTAAAVPREDRYVGVVGDEACKQSRPRSAANAAGKKSSQNFPCLSTAALTQLLGPANTAMLARHLHPELLEGLDLALATVDPSKVPEHLMLKAFESLPGASAHLQQVLEGDSEAAATLLASSLQPPLECLLDSRGGAAKGSLAPGDYYVLQTPVIQSTVPKQSASLQASTDKPVVSNAGPQAGAVSGAGKPGKADGCEDVGGQGSWQEQSGLAAEVQTLRKHREWADKKIDQLIRRVREAEGPQRLLKEEVQQLRQEKDSVESKLKEFEQSLQKLKDCTYAEAAQRREFELSLRNAQAELRGSSLREQEMQHQLREAQVAHRQEKKRREALERQLKKSQEERAEAQAGSAEAAIVAAKVEKALLAAQQSLQDTLAELETTRDALIAAQAQAKAAEQHASQLQEQLTHARAEAEARGSDLEGVIAALTAQLDEAQMAVGQVEPHPSLYSHFGGPALFEGLQNATFPGLPAMNPFGVGIEGLGAGFQPGFHPGATPPPRRQADHMRDGGVEVP